MERRRSLAGAGRPAAQRPRGGPGGGRGRPDRLDGVHAVYSSDLVRARHTAQLLAVRLGLAPSSTPGCASGTRGVGRGAHAPRSTKAGPATSRPAVGPPGTSPTTRCSPGCSTRERDRHRPPGRCAGGDARGSRPDPRAPPRRRRRPHPEPGRAVARVRRRHASASAIGSSCSTPTSHPPRADLRRSGAGPEGGTAERSRPSSSAGARRYCLRRRGRKLVSSQTPEIRLLTDPAAGAAAAATDPELNPELAAEQRHLDAAYARLDAMRRAAERVAEGYSDVNRGGTHQARLERDAAEAYTRRRLAGLDIGDTPLCFGRLDLRPGERDETPARSTSAGSRSPTTTCTPLSSTGGPRWPSPSTAPPRSSRWASPAAATSRPTAGGSSALDDEVFDAEAAADAGLHGRRRGRAARRARPRAHRPHARHRRHHPGRAGRSDPRRPHRRPRRRRRPRHRQDRGRAAPRRVPALHAPQAARRRRACCSSGRARSSCATSTRCSRRSARTRCSSPPPRRSSRGSRVRADRAAAVAAVKGDARMAKVIARASATASARCRATSSSRSTATAPPAAARLGRIVERTRARRGHAQRAPPVRRRAGARPLPSRVPARARRRVPRDRARSTRRAVDCRRPRRALRTSTVAAALARGEAAPEDWEQELAARLRRAARGPRRARAHVAGAHRRRARARPVRLRGAHPLGADGVLTPRRAAVAASATRVADVARGRLDRRRPRAHRRGRRAARAGRGGPPTSRRRARRDAGARARRDARSTSSASAATSTAADVARPLRRRRVRPDRRGRRRAAHVRPRARRRGAGSHRDAVAHARPPLPVGLDDARRRLRPGQPARARSPAGTTSSRNLPDGVPPHRVTLTVNYRTPAEIMDVANRLLPAAAPGVEPRPPGAQHRRAPRGRHGRRATSSCTAAATRRAPGVDRRGHGGGDRAAGAARRARRRARRPRRGRRRRRRASTRRSRCSTPLDAKGLEFDHVIVVEPRGSSPPTPPGSGCSTSCSPARPAS